MTQSGSLKETHDEFPHSSCEHSEKRCTKCGEIFTKTSPASAPGVVDTTSRRRFSSSGTYYGTYMKSIDESSYFGDEENKEDEKEIEDEGCTNKPKKEPLTPAQSPPPNRCSYLVKYSVNGVFQGQTRLSFEDVLMMDEFHDSELNEENSGNRFSELKSKKTEGCENDNFSNNAFTADDNNNTVDGNGRIKETEADGLERSQRVKQNLAEQKIFNNKMSDKNKDEIDTCKQQKEQVQRKSLPSTVETASNNNNFKTVQNNDKREDKSEAVAGGDGKGKTRKNGSIDSGYPHKLKKPQLSTKSLNKELSGPRVGPKPSLLTSRRSSEPPPATIKSNKLKDKMKMFSTNRKEETKDTFLTTKQKIQRNRLIANKLLKKDQDTIKKVQESEYNAERADYKNLEALQAQIKSTSDKVESLLKQKEEIEKQLVEEENKLKMQKMKYETAKEAEEKRHISNDLLTNDSSLKEELIR